VRALEPELPPGLPGAERGPLVRLVTRLLVAQAAVAGAIGLFFTRRHLPSIVVTLLVVAVLAALAVAARTGSHVAWVAMLSVEGVYVLTGLLRFMMARYLGGTLFAIITAGVLLHPAVARAYGSGPRPAGDARPEPDPGDTELGQA
jgi:hypothetical protein